MNNPTSKTQKPRTGAGSLERKRDRFTEKMNQIHGVRGYASMREAMDAKYMSAEYGYFPEDGLQERVARLTNHLIERYSHYTVDEVRSVAAQAAIDPNHPALQKYWDEIEAGSIPSSLTSVGIGSGLLSVCGDGSFPPSVEVVESQTIDSIVDDDDVAFKMLADVANEGVFEVGATASIADGAFESDDQSLTPSLSICDDDEHPTSSLVSYASATDVCVPVLVCAEVHQIDEGLAPIVVSDSGPPALGRDDFIPRSPPTRPPRTRGLAPCTDRDVKVSVASVIAADVMRRVADVPGGAFASDPFLQLNPSSRVRYPNLYRGESCLRQGTVRWCVAVATMVMVTAGGLCSLL